MVNPNIANVAKLIADPTRAMIIDALMDGRVRSASHLARMTNVTPQTVSSHLLKLVDGGFLVVEQQGRHRYYQIANSQVAEIMESLGNMAPSLKVKSLRQFEQTKAIRFARTCYDHLAGELGVRITKALIDMNVIVPVERDFEVTASGKTQFMSIGIDSDLLKHSRRKFARQCLDWSERDYHISGCLGAAIAKLFMEREWVLRLPDTHALRVTEQGKQAMSDIFGITFG